MSILQFLRIFWARRWIVVIAVAASFLGAWVVTLLVQPRYEATARVMLNFVRPDPVTGELPSAKTAGPYVDSQIELIKDYRVTGQMVDAFGWLSDPGRIRAYSSRPATDNRDFRRWLAQQVADNVKPKFQGTILEIGYSASDPVVARFAAEQLREIYLRESLAARREQAARNAAWYTQQAEGLRKLAEDAEMTKAAYERESGIIMQGRDSDLDSERLTALANQAAIGPMMSAAAAAGTSSSAMQLAQIDAQLAEAAKRLGPNHPEMQELKTRRALVAQVVAQDTAAARAAASGTTSSAAIAAALQAQKSRVIGQRDKVEKLRQLQADVDLRRDQYRAAAARAAQYMQEASISDVGLTPLGVVVTPSKPTFPNKPLMLGGSIALGAGLGLALALLLELLNRRVRGVEDLNLSSEIHCICVVEEPFRNETRRRLRRALGKLIPRRRAAGAVA